MHITLGSMQCIAVSFDYLMARVNKIYNSQYILIIFTSAINIPNEC